jgi:hypothetical protein
MTRIPCKCDKPKKTQINDEGTLNEFRTGFIVHTRCLPMRGFTGLTENKQIYVFLYIKEPKRKLFVRKFCFNNKSHTLQMKAYQITKKFCFSLSLLGRLENPKKREILTDCIRKLFREIRNIIAAVIVHSTLAGWMEWTAFR